jgi:SSS family solute:Na+ symporter
MTNKLGASTMPEFFSRRYFSKSMKIVSSVIIFIFLVPYTASVYKGLSGLFAMSFGIDFKWCIFGMALLTAVFVVAGGYMGTAVNNFIQGIVMLVGICLIVAGVLNGKGGFSEAITALSQVESEKIPEMQGAFTSMFGPEPLQLLSVVLLTSLGTWGLPQMVHKFYAIKDESAIKKGTVISTAFAIIVAGGSYFIGGFGRLYYDADTVVFDEIIPTMIQKALPDVLIGLVLLVVLSASISTLASLVLTSASTFISDFVKSFTNIKSKSELLWIRIMCGAFIVVSVVIAINPNSFITALMSLSWGALAGSFLGPFIYGLFWKRTTKLAVWASMISGVVINGLNFFLGITSPTTAGAISMILSLVIVPVFSLISDKKHKEEIDEMFLCYEEKVLVTKKSSLRENAADSAE